jgi:N-6 DNA Methylase
MSRRATEFQTIRSEGGLLPPDLLRRILDPKEKLDGTRTEDYGLPQGERLNEVITQSWARLRKHWAEFRTAAANLPAGEAGTGLTNDKWSLPLLRELGFGLLPASAGPAIGGRVYAINRLFGPVPVHLIGCGLSLDHRAAGVRGAAVSNPHGLVQEFLNRSAAHMWGIVSNGSLFRILRDNQALSRQSFLEFDLEAMFAGELYSDFVLLWLIAHATRFAPREADKPDTCWLEAWTKIANEQGTRALQDLRGGVEKALQILGEGFTAHPKNTVLRETLRIGQASLVDFHAQLLRVVYRFIFLFVSEDRTLDGQSLLHPCDGSEAARIARELYTTNYSTVRLRDLASNIKGSRHGDLWRQFQIIVGALSGDANSAAARRELALPSLGSLLWDPASTRALNDAELTNYDFLEALRHLAFTRPDKMLRPVDFKNLGAEELGGVYETLLALTPQISADGARFTFAEFAGNERKTSGSYYTPDSLVQCLLDSALDPIVEEAVKGKTGHEAEKAILALKICDPAVGSGHFLVGAAHRLARHLARVRAAAHGESEPSPLLYQHALRDVIGHCLYGVDINPMAAELCRVSLWLEAIEPGKPLSFLEHRIRCGNSLLGATPALLAKGIPDEVFTPIEGDDKEICREFKRINKDEHNRQTRLFAASTEPWQHLGNLAANLDKLDAVDDDSFDGVREKQRMYEQTIQSSDYLSGRFWADAWCAAFVWKKTREFNYPITEEVFRRIEHNPHAVDSWMRDEIERLAGQYQFFHWNLAFPDVFRVPPPGIAPENEQTGCNGGFDCVLGNPPWERVTLKEKEWFAERRPEIANAPNSAARKRLIQALRTEVPALYAKFQDSLRQADGESHLIRNSKLYPLCGRGDINLYAIFAEGMRNRLALEGRAGCVVPTGIATDDNTKFFFRDLVQSKSLVSLFDFENRKNLFEGVGHGRSKFCLLSLSRPSTRVITEARFVFFAHDVDDLRNSDKSFTLSADDISLLNPNSGTCPVFQFRRDAELTKAVFRSVPVFIKEQPPIRNPWGVSFLRMMDMANDSHLFQTTLELQDSGWREVGRSYINDTLVRVPLYEAKMSHAFNHRAGDYRDYPEGALSTHLPEVSSSRLADPHYWTLPRYWVDQSEVESSLAGKWQQRWLLGWRNVTHATNDRTLITSLIPLGGVAHSMAVILPTGATPAEVACLYANLASFAQDYLVRQKLGGINLTYGYLSQVPVFPPTAYEASWGWAAEPETLRDWLLTRVLELTYTSWDLEPFAQDCGCEGPPFRWDEERRFLLRCELDAAFFRLYLPAVANGDWLLSEGETPEDLVLLKASFPTPRDAVAYIMDTFPIVKRKDEERFNGDYRTKRVILEMYDAMAKAIRTGAPYQTRLDPPPADPSCRHPKKKIGILAFGSLIRDPGSELEPNIGMHIRTQTPFPVEYARFSAKRGGGPTLVPHESGSSVSAEILVLADEVAIDQVRDMLWRREAGRIGSGETYPAGTSANSVLVEQISDDPCVSTVLYTDFHVEGKVVNPRAEDLARRAIQSVGSAKAAEDGISYLINAIESGIKTPLTAAYREQILLQTNAGSLEEALRKTREAVTSSKEGSRA